MAFFNEFPHTRTYDSDLGWLIATVKRLSSEIQDINKITYADPIGWNITTQYERNVIVKDPQSGILYISKKPVPTGISLRNEEYWIEIGDFSYTIEYLRDAICATDEGDSLTATQPYSTGDFLWWSDKLYRANEDIIVGDAFGTNITVVQLSDLLQELETQQNSLSEELSELSPINIYKDTTIHVFGDSNTVPDYITENLRWYATVAKCLGASYINHGVSNTCWRNDVPGSGTAMRGNFRQQIAAADADENCKLVMIIGGINDFHYGEYSAATFSDAVSQTINAAHAKFPNALIVSMMDCGSQYPNGKLLGYARAVVRRGTASTSTANINCIAVPLADMCLDPGYWYNTNHYSQQGHNAIARRILSALYGNGQSYAVGPYRTVKDYTDNHPTSTGFYNCGYRVTTSIDPVRCIREDDVEIRIRPNFANTDARTTIAGDTNLFDDVPCIDSTSAQDTEEYQFIDGIVVRRAGGVTSFNPVPMVYRGNNYSSLTDSPTTRFYFQYQVNTADLNGRMNRRFHFVTF